MDINWHIASVDTISVPFRFIIQCDNLLFRFSTTRRFRFSGGGNISPEAGYCLLQSTSSRLLRPSNCIRIDSVVFCHWLVPLVSIPIDDQGRSGRHMRCHLRRTGHDAFTLGCKRRAQKEARVAHKRIMTVMLSQNLSGFLHFEGQLPPH